MLAFTPESGWLDRIPKERVQHTKNTLTDINDIIEALRLTKQRGYAIDNEENDIGVRCVGMPVLNAYGRLVAGVSISGPITTMSDAKVQECAKILQEASLHMRERIYS